MRMLPPGMGPGGGFLRLCLILACLAIAEARMASSVRKAHIIARQAEATCLDPSALQTASAFTGQEDGTTGIQPGQVESEV